jgi:large subunit ribosomal protein L18Ae
MYREYRELSKADAVTALYAEMASRHRVRARSLQVISVVEVASKDCKREYVTAFHVRTPPIDPILFRVPTISDRQLNRLTLVVSFGLVPCRLNVCLGSLSVH